MRDDMPPAIAAVSQGRCRVLRYVFSSGRELIDTGASARSRTGGSSSGCLGCLWVLQLLLIYRVLSTGIGCLML